MIFKQFPDGLIRVDFRPEELSQLIGAVGIIEKARIEMLKENFELSSNAVRNIERELKK